MTINKSVITSKNLVNCLIYFLYTIQSQYLQADPAIFEDGKLNVICAKIPGLPDQKLIFEYDAAADAEFLLTGYADANDIHPLACAGSFDHSTNELEISGVRVDRARYDVVLKLIAENLPYRFALTSAIEKTVDPSNFGFVESSWTITNAESGVKDSIFVNDSPVMDVNHDGLDDIVFTGPYWTDTGWVDETVPMHWLMNMGDGTFQAGDSSAFPESSALVHIRHIRIADFNNDGLDDLTAVSHGYDVQPFPGERNLLLVSEAGIAYQDPSLANPDFDYQGFTHSMDVGDINADGHLDIVFGDLFMISDPTGDGSLVRILLNDGTGQFSRQTGTISTNSKTGLLSLKLSDLDADGAPEMIIGGWQEGSETQIYWNDGSGSFDSDNYTVLDSFNVAGEDYYDALAIAVLDINSDGDKDLAISRSARYNGRAIQLLINNGDRTFTDVTSTHSPWESESSTVADATVIPFYLNVLDFNGDGFDDLHLGYTGDEQNNKSFIWLRNEDGTSIEYNPSDVQFSGVMWPVDYDLDGDIDLVTKDWAHEQGRWRILINQLVTTP